MVSTLDLQKTQSLSFNVMPCRWWLRNPPRFITHVHSPCLVIAVVVYVNSPVTNMTRAFAATPEEFENRGFTLKTHQMFSVYATPEEFVNATITGHFGFVFEENSGREITWLSWRQNEKSAMFSNSSSLKSVFEKLRFRDRLVWTVGLIEEMKMHFQISLEWGVYDVLEGKLKHRMFTSSCWELCLYMPYLLLLEDTKIFSKANFFKQIAKI